MNTSNKTSTLSADLNSFIYGVSRRNFQNAAEFTKIGISLLKSFPAARDAVLEYFSMIFHESVNVSLNQSDYENDGTSNIIDSVTLIGQELCNLGESWAPHISLWCIKLIMEIATDKASLPNNILQSTEPVRVLLDITTQFLTLLKSDERAKCIDMMLDNRACSWAVGWVGRAEPALVAPRALALPPDAAKAVLAHLGNHPPALHHVRAALLQLQNEALKVDSPIEKSRDVIPYVLNLASKSDIVLKALVQNIEETLTDKVVERLCVICTLHCRSSAWEAIGPATLLALLMKANLKCLLLLLKYAQKILFCRQLLEYLLQKLELESLYPDKKIPLISSATEEVEIVRERILSGTRLDQYSLARVLVLVCYAMPAEFVNTISYLLLYCRDDTSLALLVRIISGTITMHTPKDTSDVSIDNDIYQNFVRIAVEYGLRDAMKADTQIKLYFVMEDVPKDQKTYLHHFCLNIIKLLRWENSNRVAHLRTRPIGRAVEANLFFFGDALNEYATLLRVKPECTMATLDEMPTCHAMTELLDRVDLSGTKSPPPNVEVILKLVQSTVRYFFRCLHEPCVLSKMRGMQTACRLLRKLCLMCKLARSIALRSIIETAMFREQNLFGSKSMDKAVDDHTSEPRLIDINQKHGPITQLTQSHTSVFHAGIIGKGVRKQTESGNIDDVPPTLTTNTELLMGALMSCMDGNAGVVEGATSMALLLVELVSPDVMYNGLPWPDEDFTKQVSIERELYMRAVLSSSGAARAVLRRAAGARPALALASALLRAAAAAVHHHHLDRQTQSKELSREMATLKELLTLMTLGQLLPHPLCHMLELAPELTPSELVQVLRDCLWNYTRDHVPSPSLFACDSTGLHWRDPSSCKPPATYTDTLRIIIQKRIATLGHLYPIMFLNLEKADI